MVALYTLQYGGQRYCNLYYFITAVMTYVIQRLPSACVSAPPPAAIGSLARRPAEMRTDRGAAKLQSAVLTECR